MTLATLKRGCACLAAIALAACVSATSPTIAQETPAPAETTAPAETAAPTGLAGWNEAVITTQAPQDWIDFLTQIAGWEVRVDTAMGDGMKELWDLPEEATGREVLLGNIGTDSGYIRLVHLDGVEQDWKRADTRPWDTGGIFNLNLRVVGMDDIWDQMQGTGWHGDSPPIQYGFGPFEVIEWIAQGPDAVRFAMIERLEPPLEGWPHLKAISRTFNSTQTVADMPAALAFYQDVLGMETYLEASSAAKEPGENVLGLTHNDAVDVPRQIYILHPQGVNEGSVELVSFDGAMGSDLSDKRAPHNIGLSVLRFPVEDLDATMSVLTERGASFAAEPMTLDVAPYGQIRAVSLYSPEGARLELYEILD